MAKRILIVDDEKDARTVLNNRLAGAGYEIIEAANGEAALVIARAQRPDLIILDILMPGMDGTETSEALKRDPDTKDIPVIFLTCLITKTDEKHGHIRGGKYFLAKPYDPDELMDIVSKCVRGE